jgi:Heavy metal binding domain
MKLGLATSDTPKSTRQWKHLAAGGLALAAALTAPAVLPARGGLRAHEACATETQAAVYVCPMHPEVTSDKPGRCPKCNMKLELSPPPPAPPRAAKGGAAPAWARK